jgi:catechol 2,3-dioxygenase-like lactoylglutathione lyase family enzyme
MFQPRDIDHLVLRVIDLERMIRFYCDILNCTLHWRRPDLGLVHLRAGNAMIDLVPVDGPLGKKGGAAPGAEARNVDHFCLRVHPFDAESIVSELKARGIEIGEIGTRFGAQGEGPSVYVRDPEGNVVELKGEIAPR